MFLKKLGNVGFVTLGLALRIIFHSEELIFYTKTNSSCNFFINKKE